MMNEPIAPGAPIKARMTKSRTQHLSQPVPPAPKKGARPYSLMDPLGAKLRCARVLNFRDADGLLDPEDDVEASFAEWKLE